MTRFAGDEGFCGVGGGVAGAGEDVAVDVAGDAGGGVPEAFGDQGDGDAGLDLEAGGQVPQVVYADGAYAGGEDVVFSGTRR